MDKLHKSVEEVYIGVLDVHDIFLLNNNFYVVLDDCFYIEGVPYVVAACLGKHISFSAAFVSSIFFFASDFRVLYGGEHYGC